MAAFVALSARQREIRIAGRWQVRLPPPGLAIRQLAISALDLSASAAALWFLLPEGVIDLPAFFAWYAIVLQGQADAAHDAEATRNFLSRARGSELIVLPDANPPYEETSHWVPQLSASVRKIAAQGTPALVAPQELKGLPIVEVAAQAGNSDILAVLISGDGGWAGIDKKVAATLSAQGIAVAGVDSLRYFWSARTPQSTAADLDRILRYYLVTWHKRQVLLIGYSQGADVLPFIIN